MGKCLHRHQAVSCYFVIDGNISAQPHTLIIHAFCDSNSTFFRNRVSMTVINV